jgi:hypothetical protein
VCPSKELTVRSSGCGFRGKKCQIPSDLLGYNKVYWPSLNCSYNDFAYWKLLWERYGWCSGLTQREWFKLAIEIFDPINFIVGLFEKGTTFPALSQNPGWTYFPSTGLSLSTKHRFNNSRRLDTVHPCQGEATLDLSKSDLSTP